MKSIRRKIKTLRTKSEIKNKSKKRLYKVKSRLIRQYMKGGGNIQTACEKYFSDGPSILPTPLRTESSEDDEKYQRVFDSIKESDTNENSLLIVKIGSNDSDAAIVEGSRGMGGNLFWESLPLPQGPKKTEIKSLLESKNLARPLNRNAGDNPISLIAISPVDSYRNYEYPFIDTSKSVWTDEIVITNSHYIKGEFPIGPNFNTESFNYKILYHLITRPGPLIIFNAMGSWCYQSIKYILDIRSLNKQFTLYTGLVDTIENVSCEIGIPIYPEPEEVCKDKRR